MSYRPKPFFLYEPTLQVRSRYVALVGPAVGIVAVEVGLGGGEGVAEVEDLIRSQPLPDKNIPTPPRSASGTSVHCLFCWSPSVSCRTPSLPPTTRSPPGNRSCPSGHLVLASGRLAERRTSARSCPRRPWRSSWGCSPSPSLNCFCVTSWTPSQNSFVISTSCCGPSCDTASRREASCPLISVPIVDLLRLGEPIVNFPGGMRTSFMPMQLVIAVGHHMGGTSVRACAVSPALP